ncbi:hypothetical protein GWI33_012502 [Rhynchophorus ferrugineus]|uniref:Uncharacterized protein n=1 Tax=Rhynchophorus ferrugineus TaxID=354439 RepID=A0A834MAU7_RHYFE|nr:hypothetical protein GWI33_012502 [Rhynchophorus ferrugineus]
MPRCLMAKKWKSYPWSDRSHQEPAKDAEEEEEIIDVVGDSQGACWGPSSPTEGATAPSPPPGSPSGTTILYNGKFWFLKLDLTVEYIFKISTQQLSKIKRLNE